MPKVPLRVYSKFQLRCILTDPSVNPDQPPGDFKPMPKETFYSFVHPIFSEPAYQAQLKTVTLESFKKMKLLPLQLVQIILNEAGISLADGLEK